MRDIFEEWGGWIFVLMLLIIGGIISDILKCCERTSCLKNHTPTECKEIK